MGIKKKSTIRNIVNIIGIFFIVMCLCSGISSLLYGQKNTNSQTPLELQVTQFVEPTLAPTPINTLEPKPALELSISQALGTCNRNIPCLTKIVYDDPETGDILIHWAINDNLTENLIRIGAQNDATKILKAVANSGINYTYITLVGTFPMQDKFGNVAETETVRLVFEKITVSKINWANFLSSNIYDIADIHVIHPVFQDQ